jgi:tetratricopeptide (TPR) repeat protein
VFDLLVFLVTHRDRAVDKDELQDQVWPGMVVTETALTRAVMKARKAVGDDAATQAVIKTIHGHGYRFVAPLEEPATAESSIQAPVEPSPSATEPAPTRKGRVYWITAAVVLMALLSWVMLRPTQTIGGEVRIAVLPLSNDTGNAELDWTRLGLMSFASGLIETDGQLAVVADSSVVGLADNIGWSGQLDGADSEALVNKLRRVYGATHLLAMQLEGSGETLRMNYSLLKPDGETERGTMVGEQGSDLTQGVVHAVYGSLLGRLRPQSDVPAVSDDPFINEAFARGVGLLVEGRCEDAVPLFRVVIDEQPALEQPRFRMAYCLRVLGQWQEAESILLALISEQTEQPAARPLGSSQNLLGVLYNRTGRLDEAETRYNQALQLAREIGDDDLRAQVLNNLAIMADDRSEFDLAQSLIDRAILAYRAAGREGPPGQLWSAVANLCMSRGQLVEADEYLENALAAFRDIGDQRNEAKMLNNTGYLRRLQGRLDEAEMFHLQSLEIRQRIGDRVGVGRIYNMLATVYSSRGLYDQAAESAQSAVAIARETDDRLFEATALAQLGDVERSLGEAGAARQHYLQARAIFVDIQDHMRILQADLKIARMDLRESRLDEAEQLAEAVRSEAIESGIMQAEVQATELLADVALARADFALAVSLYGESLARVRESSWRGKENTLLTKLADVHLQLGETSAAEPLIGALSRQPPNVQSLKVQAGFEYAIGNASQAVELMGQAKKMAGEHWAAASEAAYQQYRLAIQVEEESS